MEYSYDPFTVPGWSDNNYPAKGESDWLTAAADWVDEHLTGIDTKELEWIVIYPEVFSDEGICAIVMTMTKEWIICVTVYHNSLKISDAYLYRKAE